MSLSFLKRSPQQEEEEEEEQQQQQQQQQEQEKKWYETCLWYLKNTWYVILSRDRVDSGKFVSPKFLPLFALDDAAEFTANLHLVRGGTRYWKLGAKKAPEKILELPPH